MNKGFASWRTLTRLLLLALAFYALGRAGRPPTDNLSTAWDQAPRASISPRPKVKAGTNKPVRPSGDTAKNVNVELPSENVKAPPG